MEREGKEEVGYFGPEVWWPLEKEVENEACRCLIGALGGFRLKIEVATVKIEVVTLASAGSCVWEEALHWMQVGPLQQLLVGLQRLEVDRL